MTKNEQKQVMRATQQGRGALLATLAVIHRAGSARTQKEVIQQINDANAMHEFSYVNGCLIYNHGN